MTAAGGGSQLRGPRALVSGQRSALAEPSKAQASCPPATEQAPATPLAPPRNSERKGNRKHSAAWAPFEWDPHTQPRGHQQSAGQRTPGPSKDPPLKPEPTSRPTSRGQPGQPGRLLTHSPQPTARRLFTISNSLSTGKEFAKE